jgi:hypothetical protein
MRDTALDNYLNNLVKKGKITQDQANKFKEWLNSRPSIPNLSIPKGCFHGMGRSGWGFGSKYVPHTSNVTSNQ